MKPRSRHVYKADFYCKRCGLPVGIDHDCEMEDYLHHARYFGPIDQIKASKAYEETLTRDKIEIRSQAREIITTLIHLLDETYSVTDKDHAYVEKIRKEWCTVDIKIEYRAADELDQFQDKSLRTMELETSSARDKMLKRRNEAWKQEYLQQPFEDERTKKT